MGYVVHCQRFYYEVYIGRGSKWGNPYSHKTGTKAKEVVASREEAIEKYEQYLHDSGLIDQVSELKGKILGCWCYPKACHGDVLARYANKEELEEGMKLGFTGTREGMTRKQKDRFRSLVNQIKPSEFHHGMCKGADSEAHDIVRSECPSCKIITHPGPVWSRTKVHRESDFEHPCKGYIERDHDIVNAVDYLIGTPNTAQEVIRSGTWTTIRYAKKVGVKGRILVP